MRKRQGLGRRQREVERRAAAAAGARVRPHPATVATITFAIVAQTGIMYNGLWYPIIIAGMTVLIGTLFIRETKDVDIDARD